MVIYRQIVEIISQEMGKKTADLFIDFYSDFSKEEQIEGAKELLCSVVGEKRTEDLLKNKNIIK